MLERIRHLPGEVLDLDAYRADFEHHWTRIEDIFWKLERAQTFCEPGDTSWEAMTQGRWGHALDLIQARHQAVVTEHQQIKSQGIESRRIRIVEFPITPYLQWELHSQRSRTEAGQRTRVLEASKLGALEADGPVPELNILGTQAMYEIVYDDTGTLAGGRRLIDHDVIGACRAEMAELWEQAEELLPFFAREIAPLPAPTPDRV